MKVKDLLEMEIDIDVYDNVCDELAIAFDGPMELTEAGKQKFAEVLEYDVWLTSVHDYSANMVAIVDVDDENEEVFEHKLEAAKELFEAAAGYCSVHEWKEWFVED